MSQKREKIGSLFNFTERQHVYLLSEAIEIDLIDGYDVSRRRVFLNEVELVTLHRQRRWASAMLLGAVGGLILVPGVIMAFTLHGQILARLIGLLVFGLLALPFLVPAVWMLVMPSVVLSVMGPRTKAVMRFSSFNRRAEQTRDRLVKAVTTAQHHGLTTPT